MSPEDRAQWECQLKSQVISTRDLTVTALLNRVEQLERELADARDALPRPASALSRDDLGRIVRNAWCGWAKNQPQVRMKDSWLVPYEELSEPDKEVDRLIAEAVVRRIELPRPVAIVMEKNGGGAHVFYDLNEASEFKWRIGGGLYFGDDELTVHLATPEKS